MHAESHSILAALAAAALVLAASSYLLVGQLAHYSMLALASENPRHLVLVGAVASVAALAHEAIVRGVLYSALRRRLPAGFAAPSAALAGLVLPVIARWKFLPHSSAPAPVVLGQALIVELLLSLALTWLALGAGSWLAGGCALAALWIFRLFSVVTFFGAVVPLLEACAAAAAAFLVTAVLSKPLSPYRDRVLGVS